MALTLDECVAHRWAVRNSGHVLEICDALRHDHSGGCNRETGGVEDAAAPQPEPTLGHCDCNGSGPE